MKDFGKLKYVRTILAGASRLVNLIRNRDRLSSKLASLQQPRTPQVLINLGDTRFAASISMCERLLQLQDKVQELAESDVWDTARSKATGDRKPVFDTVKKTIERASLWDMLARIVQAMEPVRHVLRLADDDKPSMGIAYSSLIALRESIEEREVKLSPDVTKARKRRDDVLQIVDRRMQFIMQPVYRAPIHRFFSNTCQARGRFSW